MIDFELICRNGEIKDKRILIIGGGYSAEDVALQCQKFGSGEVHMAYNRAPLGYVPAQEHPPVDHFEGPRTAHFQDGLKADFDLVIKIKKDMTIGLLCKS